LLLSSFNTILFFFSSLIQIQIHFRWWSNLSQRVSYKNIFYCRFLFSLLLEFHKNSFQYENIFDYVFFSLSLSLSLSTFFFSVWITLKYKIKLSLTLITSLMLLLMMMMPSCSMFLCECICNTTRGESV
jgi:hypothetical protein